MKQPPKEATFEKTRMKRVDFYGEALDRLRNEVGVVLQLIRKHNDGATNKIGYWAGIRMILPIVEAVSHVAGQAPQEFLRNQLGIQTPYLAWDLFRHSLIHGDYLHTGRYQSKQVGWGVTMKGQGHSITSGHICIDITHLYEKLKEFLETEVAGNDQSIADVEVGVVYTPKSKQEVLNDFAKV